MWHPKLHFSFCNLHNYIFIHHRHCGFAIKAFWQMKRWPLNAARASSPWSSLQNMVCWLSPVMKTVLICEPSAGLFILRWVCRSEEKGVVFHPLHKSIRGARWARLSLADRLAHCLYSEETGCLFVMMTQAQRHPKHLMLQGTLVQFNPIKPNKIKTHRPPTCQNIHKNSRNPTSAVYYKSQPN